MFSGISYRFGTSIDSITAVGSTSQKRAIFLRMSSSTGFSVRKTKMLGWIPKPRSSRTECWVGLVFISPAAPRYGTKVVWMYKTLSSPASFFICRIASINGWDSMSPTVPPISVITTSASVLSPARWIFSLIILVMWGITWTVRPK